MMWPGLNCSPRCSGGRHGCGKVWPWFAAVFSVLVLLTILSACSSGSLGERAAASDVYKRQGERAARPVLPSLTRATVNGVPGVWMDERDAGTLALWIEEVSP